MIFAIIENLLVCVIADWLFINKHDTYNWVNGTSLITFDMGNGYMAW